MSEGAKRETLTELFVDLHLDTENLQKKLNIVSEGLAAIAKELAEVDKK